MRPARPAARLVSVPLEAKGLGMQGYSVAEKLKHLADLHEADALNAEEFASAKQRVLGAAKTRSPHLDPQPPSDPLPSGTGNQQLGHVGEVGSGSPESGVSRSGSGTTREDLPAVLDGARSEPPDEASTQAKAPRPSTRADVSDAHARFFAWYRQELTTRGSEQSDSDPALREPDGGDDAHSEMRAVPARSESTANGVAKVSHKPESAKPQRRVSALILVGSLLLVVLALAAVSQGDGPSGQTVSQEAPPRAEPDRPPTQTQPAPIDDREAWRAALTSCEVDANGFVRVEGELANDSGSIRSYDVFIVLDGQGAMRAGSGHSSVTGVAPGTVRNFTMTTTASSVAGAVSDCRIDRVTVR